MHKRVVTLAIKEEELEKVKVLTVMMEIMKPKSLKTIHQRIFKMMQILPVMKLQVETLK